ncbi:DUF4395 domain-containing protein [Microbacterium sp. W1N]|uniref:DUF4395 domain-containing protein n=1 Tax=Microbacterium festucae TaxID=2977531 RepID=UPI0021BED2A3|nr:DUF4395 domain-containing protein [Microbacterium festucae]MCT9821512.1 DUF4395 domain-containing protein [Microbacterium festucae]
MADRAPRGIDPRGPRFAAAITALLLAVDVVLGLTGLSTAKASPEWFAANPLPGTGDFAFIAGAWAVAVVPLSARLLDPGFLLLLVIALLFVWGVVSPRTAVWGALFRRVVQPRLAPPATLEDPRPPRFAQGVGLFVTGAGVVLHLLGVPYAVPVAAGIAFVAAFLNAVFGLCLGCQMYMLLQRVGVVGRTRPA